MWLFKFWKKVSSTLRVLHCRYYSVADSYFVTTPIFYVNGAPHIGHLQSCLYADAFHRIQRLMGKKTVFSTGTDEHGLKIQQAARAAGKDPFEFCTEVSQEFKDVFKKSDICFTNFIRTTDQQHVKAVEHFWVKIKSNGFIYKGVYEGWYNVSDETFVPSSQVKLVEDASGTKAVCSESGQLLEKFHEENYIFALSKFQKDLEYWIKKDVVKPKIYVNILEQWIKDGLHDLSVSRHRSRLPWGIPVPGDSTQTIYVWLDALVSYLTAGGYPEPQYQWPAACHVIGKDILKFHGIYWPAFLIAAGMEPPDSLFCHSHWTVDHEKMSKSKGNVIDPLALIEKFGCDGLRYFLLRAAIPESDANYSETKILRLLNAELADTLGNLLSRCCAPAVNKKQMLPPFSKEAFSTICDNSVQELIETTSKLPRLVLERYMEGDFYHGIEIIMECLRKANAFVQWQKPWELVKDTSSFSQSKLDTVLRIAFEVIRISGLLLQPVIPSTAASLLDKLGVSNSERNWEDVHRFSLDLRTLNFEEEEKTLRKENFVLFARRKA